jgi:ubiquinone/menaquinone biosynthesis C-methylase UbiE
MTEKVSYRRYSGTAAENYERYFVPAIARPVAADLLRAANLQPGERVLDVACGTGIIARLAAEQVGPTGVVSGVDVAADMIEVARATAAPSEPVIKWSQGDAAALPSPTPEPYPAARTSRSLAAKAAGSLPGDHWLAANPP